jgi:hypothetical protein
VFAPFFKRDSSISEILDLKMTTELEIFLQNNGCHFITLPERIDATPSSTATSNTNIAMTTSIQEATGVTLPGTTEASVLEYSLTTGTFEASGTGALKPFEGESTTTASSTSSPSASTVPTCEIIPLNQVVLSCDKMALLLMQRLPLFECYTEVRSFCDFIVKIDSREFRLTQTRRLIQRVEDERRALLDVFDAFVRELDAWYYYPEVICKYFRFGAKRKEEMRMILISMIPSLAIPSNNVHSTREVVTRLKAIEVNISRLCAPNADSFDFIAEVIKQREENGIAIAHEFSASFTVWFVFLVDFDFADKQDTSHDVRLRLPECLRKCLPQDLAENLTIASEHIDRLFLPLSELRFESVARFLESLWQLQDLATALVASGHSAATDLVSSFASRLRQFHLLIRLCVQNSLSRLRGLGIDQIDITRMILSFPNE